MLFTSGSVALGSITTNTNLTAYGAPESIVPFGTAATKAAVTDVKHTVMMTVDGGVVDHLIRNKSTYRALPFQNNLSIMRHQVWGTYGVGMRIDGLARVLKQDITITGLPD